MSNRQLQIVLTLTESTERSPLPNLKATIMAELLRPVDGMDWTGVVRADISWTYLPVTG